MNLAASEDVRLLIVADNPLARTGLAALLADQAGCTVVGQLAASADLPAALGAYRPEILVWDLGWEPASTLERLREVAEIEAGPRVVVLLPGEDQAADVWRAGAAGLLLQNTDADTLAAALLAVARGMVVLDPALARAMLETREPLPEPPTEALTPRELEVLQLIAHGLPNKTIAQRLAISDHTVKFHVNAILSKLNAQSRTDAVVRAARLGLIVL
jgi:DNA-binding NarL/FixJ family response regulator